MTNRRGGVHPPEPAQPAEWPSRSGVRQRVVGEASDRRAEPITVRPPPLDFEDECSAQTVMRKLPAEFIAKLKRLEETPPAEPFDDEVTVVGVLPWTPDMEPSPEMKRASEPEIAMVRPVMSSPVISSPVISTPSVSEAAPEAIPAAPRLPASRDLFELEIPAARVSRDPLPYIMIVLAMGLIALLVSLYRH